MSKVMLVGDGAVGSAFANDLLQHVSLDELIIVDRKTQKAAGDAMDLEDLAM
ncbi:MAG: L-lactate dehydrogenase, partial [Limosilactobacillus mucosae]|nr:L-lactate dehydrogenase [Limosilactobacillus mucosae]